MQQIDKPVWLKSKGYLHITAQLQTEKRIKELIGKIYNTDFISRYAFFPLIHSNILERKYKKTGKPGKERSHVQLDDNGYHVSSAKVRPLHYATHFDALIFGYYASLIQGRYEEKIAMTPGLGECIIAYRKIPSEVAGKNKGTIHFAHEIFEEIRRKSKDGKECAVLTFDIKGFFPSLDHDRLKASWAKIMDFERLPPHHFNVFKAATQFSYILLDDLRVKKGKSTKAAFDEKELARIRNVHGIQALFESPRAFREKVKRGELKLYKYPFRHKITKKPVGIPQGLPISATLANIYLMDFDLEIFNELVVKSGCYYRRYSDDIVIVCSLENAAAVGEKVMSEMHINKMEISTNKTEKFHFKHLVFGKNLERLTSVKITEGKEYPGLPFTYLGFEFNGQKALVKSANVAKFYRRMIRSVKTKANRAKREAQKNGSEELRIFRRQLHNLYMAKSLHEMKTRNRWKKIVPIEGGGFRLKTGVKEKKMRSNYFYYLERAGHIMQEPAITRQIRKHKHIFNQAISRHLKKAMHGL